LDLAVLLGVSVLNQRMADARLRGKRLQAPARRDNIRAVRRSIPALLSGACLIFSLLAPGLAAACCLPAPTRACCTKAAPNAAMQSLERASCCKASEVKSGAESPATILTPSPTQPIPSLAVPAAWLAPRAVRPVPTVVPVSCRSSLAAGPPLPLRI
jgi:hypothetical protein